MSFCSDRVVIVGNSMNSKIAIKAKRNYILLPLLMLWLCAWSVGGVAVIAMLLISSLGEVFGLIQTDTTLVEKIGTYLLLLIWLGGWAFGWLMVYVQIAWMLYGREIVEIDTKSMVKQLEIPLYFRRRIFELEKVRFVRQLPPKINFESAVHNIATALGTFAEFPFVFRGGRVGFEHSGNTVQIGSELEAWEAQAIKDKIVEALGTRVAA